MKLDGARSNVIDSKLSCQRIRHLQSVSIFSARKDGYAHQSSRRECISAEGSGESVVSCKPIVIANLIVSPIDCEKSVRRCERHAFT
jgi:hypothetical protein